MSTFVRFFAIAISATGLFAQYSPQFESADIRLSGPGPGSDITTPSLTVARDHTLRFVHLTLRDLIMLAYGVGLSQIEGPPFLYGRQQDSPLERFDIVAKVPAGAHSEDVPLMLRSLLATRFHLSLHRETRTMQVYALEVAKGGSKLKASPGDAASGAGCTRSRAAKTTLAAVCNHMRPADIAQQLQILAPGYFLNSPVVDATGLKGVYDFRLEWTTSTKAQKGGGSAPAMQQAVEDQLGLRLEQRPQPIEMLIIDKLNQTPN